MNRREVELVLCPQCRAPVGVPCVQTHGRTGTHKARARWLKVQEAEVVPPQPGVVELWTDGSCPANPGPGGWATIMRFGEHEKVLVGSHPATTNNVMEMVAVWHGLMAVTRPSPVVVYSDSSYVLDGLRKGWVERWQRNGWRTRDGRDVANGGLWRVLEIAARKHRVRWEQVAGHSGVTLNERCDLLAMMQVPEAEAPGVSELDEAFDAVLADPLT